MTDSVTPDIDRWQDVHARACKAEQQVIVAGLSHLSAGSRLPTDLEIETAKTLRAMATVQFDSAVQELRQIARRQMLGTRLRNPPNDGAGGSGFGQPS